MNESIISAPESTIEAVSELNNENKIKSMSISELADYLAELLSKEELAEKKIIEQIKSQFYKKLQSMSEEDKANNEIQEARFGDLINQFKVKDRERVAKIEAELQENKTKKEALLSKFAALLTSKDDFGLIYAKYKDIKDEWHSIGDVEPAIEKTIRKEYNRLNEEFYDLKHLNDEYRDLDFKKNLELKEHILKSIEDLGSDSDVVKALKRLQTLQREWHQIGPVAKEMRANINAKFKELSNIIHKKHQDFFLELKANEEENARKKQEIIHEIESIISSLDNKSNAWEANTKKILELQSDWKTIGRSSKKDGEDLFSSFRGLCDEFFAKKSEFFASRKELFEEIYKNKEDIIAKAKKIISSDANIDRKSQKLKELQKEWQEIKGGQSKRNEQLWREFRAVCDEFFISYKEDKKEQDKEQKQNLELKLELISKLEKVLEDKTQNLSKEINNIRKEWDKIGHVPFAQKDKIYNKFQKLIKKHFKKNKEIIAEKRLSGYEESIKDLSTNNELRKEHNRMTKIMERMQQEAHVFELNMQKLNISEGSTIYKDIKRKKEKLEDDIRLMEEKLLIISNKMNKD